MQSHPSAAVGTPENPSHQVFTVANCITLARLALTAIFLFLFIDHQDRHIALAIYALAACTDWIDGQIARRTQTVTWFGKILDPIVDRALLATGVIGLMVRGELPPWICILLVGRDIYLTIGAKIISIYQSRPIDVIYAGKVTTALLMSGFCLMLLGTPVLPALNFVDVSWLPWFNHQSAPLGIIFVYIGSVFSLITAAIYTYKGYCIRNLAMQSQGQLNTTTDSYNAKL